MTTSLMHFLPMSLLVCPSSDKGSDDTGSDTAAAETILLSGGGQHTCMLNIDNEISCWGSDDFGQVSGAPEGKFTELTGGWFHSCALGDIGTLAC